MTVATFRTDPELERLRTAAELARERADIAAHDCRRISREIVDLLTALSRPCAREDHKAKLAGLDRLTAEQDRAGAVWGRAQREARELADAAELRWLAVRS